MVQRFLKSVLLWTLLALPAAAAGEPLKLDGVWIGEEADESGTRYEIIQGLAFAAASGVRLRIESDRLSLTLHADTESETRQSSRFSVVGRHGRRLTIASELPMAGGLPGRPAESDFTFESPDRMWWRPHVGRSLTFVLRREGAIAKADGPAAPALSELAGQWRAVDVEGNTPGMASYFRLRSGERRVEFRHGALRYSERGSRGREVAVREVSGGEVAELEVAGGVRFQLRRAESGPGRIALRLVGESYWTVYEREGEGRKTEERESE